MPPKLLPLLCLPVLSVFAVGCKSPHYADKGAAMGAVTGAVVGAVVGEHNDNPLAGAVIGTAAGAVAGGMIGESIDADIARNNVIIEQQMGRRMAGAVTIADVMSMTQAGLPDNVIITHMRANGVAHPPTTNDLIAMKNQGVSDAVINAMQNPPIPVATRPAPRPVVIEEHHYIGPAYRRPTHWHHHHQHRRPHHGARVGVSFGL